MTSAESRRLFPPSICPICLKLIARKELKVAKPFNCPNCQQLVRTSKLFRALMYISCYGIPTLIAYSSGASLLFALILWVILAFVFAAIYIVIATAISPARLEVVDKKAEDIQSLDLMK
jgi:hypothetical protein